MRIKYNMIREARQKKGYSQEYIAFCLNISQPQYSKLENGEKVFEIDKLSRLFDVLDINPLKVIDFSEKQKGVISENLKNYTLEQKIEQFNFLLLTAEECREVEGGSNYLSYYKNVHIFAVC